MSNGGFIGLTKNTGDGKIDGIGGRPTRPVGETSIFYNEALDGVPRNDDLFAIRILGQTAQVEWLKDIIKSQVASTDFKVVPDVPDDEDREPTDREREAAKEIEQFFKGNFNSNPTTIDDLHGLLLDDILDLNSGVLELVSDDDGYLDALIPRDGLTFTFNEKQSGMLPDTGSDEPAYYQFSLTAHAQQYFDTDRRGIDIRDLRDDFYNVPFTRIFNREQKKFTRDQIVWFSEPQNAKTYTPYGRGRTQKVKEYAEIMINGDHHRNKFFMDNEFHKGVLAVDSNMSQKDKEALRKRFKNQAGNEHELPIVGSSESLDYISIDPEPEKMQFLESQKWYTKGVLRAYGLNDVAGGMLENANKGISDNGKEQIFRRVTGPLLTMFENRWNNEVLPFMREYQAVDGNVKFQYEPENRFLQRIENDIIDQELNNGTLTINEARERKGKEPFGPVGDLPKNAFEKLANSVPDYVAEQLNEDLEDVPSGGSGAENPFELTVNNNEEQSKEPQKIEINNYDDGQKETQESSSEETKQRSFDDYPQEAVENARTALEARDNPDFDNDECGTRVGWERANQLDNGESLTVDTIERMHSFFERHDGNQEVDEPPKEEDCGWLTWMAWGGQAAFDWAEEKLEEIEENEKESGKTGSGRTSPTDIDSYRKAFKHKDELLKQTKDALRNERGFNDVPGIVEHKNEMKKDVAQVFESIDLEQELRNEFPEESQENGVLVNADEIVENLNFRDRLGSVIESNNLNALEMSAEHHEQEIEQETEERLTIPEESKVEISFDIMDTFTADIIRNEALSAATEIQSSIKDRIKNQILKGAEKGEGIDKITRRIEDVKSDITKDHAELVARTETLSSSRKGSQALAESTDLVGGKEWNSTDDARVREWHKVMDGEIVPKDDVFTVPKVRDDSQPSDYPRTARVVGEDQPYNCRCAMSPVLAEDMPDDPQQLEADFDGVNVDLGMTKRQYEIWKEHGQEYDSFEQFWSTTKQKESVSSISDKFGMSRTTVYDWNEEIDEIKNPEGVPENAYPVQSADDCNGQTTEGPRGGLYCIPEDSEDEDNGEDEMAEEIRESWSDKKDSEINPANAESIESPSEVGVDGDVSESFRVAKMEDGSQVFVKSDGFITEEVGSDVLNELGVSAARTEFNEENDQVASEAIDGDILDKKAPNQDSYVDAMAGSILIGDADSNSMNFIVDEDGEVSRIDTEAIMDEGLEADWVQDAIESQVENQARAAGMSESEAKDRINSRAEEIADEVNLDDLDQYGRNERSEEIVKTIKDNIEFIRENGGIL